MTFRIEGLSREHFLQYIGRADDELAAMNAHRVIATEDNAYPCRISLLAIRANDAVGMMINAEVGGGEVGYRAVVGYLWRCVLACARRTARVLCSEGGAVALS